MKLIDTERRLDLAKKSETTKDRNLRESSELGRSCPRVTIVTPSFNQARFLEQTILSVIGQDYPNIEYIIIDGGSTDGSVDIILRHADSLAYWESKPDKGQTHAINKGWRRATGEYLWWLNSDDALPENAIRTAVDFLMSHPEVDLVYGDQYLIDEEGKMLRRHNYRDFDFNAFILYWHDISQAGALARRRVLDRIGFLDEGKHFLMDRDYWLRLALAGGKIAHLAEPMAYFRVYPMSKTQTGSSKSVSERYEVTNLVLQTPDLPHMLDRSRGQIWCNTHLGCSRVYMKCGEYVQALGETWLAFRSHPASVIRVTAWSNLFLSLIGILLGQRLVERMRAAVRGIRRRFAADYDCIYSKKE